MGTFVEVRDKLGELQQDLGRLKDGVDRAIDELPPGWEIRSITRSEQNGWLAVIECAGAPSHTTKFMPIVGRGKTIADAIWDASQIALPRVR